MKGYRTPSWFRMKGVLDRKAKLGKGRAASAKPVPRRKRQP